LRINTCGYELALVEQATQAISDDLPALRKSSRDYLLKKMLLTRERLRYRYHANDR
jgi:hypothetical protein